MDHERILPYWVATKRLGFSLVIICFIMIVAGLGYSHLLDDYKFLGFPLGLLILGQFVVVLCVGAMFWFTGAQDRIDARFGANEDI